jgi:hypothetical protein
MSIALSVVLVLQKEKACAEIKKAHIFNYPKSKKL